MNITLLTGGVGGSKLGLGFHHIGCELTAIVNTGDDVVVHGLHVSPDPDILIYTLADVVNAANGWGIRDDTFHVAEQLTHYGRDTWFQLGDRDLATHIYRTTMLSSGATLSEALDAIRKCHDVSARILPMSDDPVCTMLHTDQGVMHLQEYLVRRRCQPQVRKIEYRGAVQARPAPGVIDAIKTADLVVIAPSNPLISIGPIVAVPGVRSALRQKRDGVVAVCPLVGGKSLKGPTDRMMAQLGYDVSAAAIAGMYRDICSALILDNSDDGDCAAVEAAGLRPVLLRTMMETLEDKGALAEAILARCAPS